MDVRQAVHLAKTYVVELFENEQITNLGLEEVDFDDTSRVWRITIGFSRPWDRVAPSTIATIAGASVARSYKVVHIEDATGRVVAVKTRESKS